MYKIIGENTVAYKKFNSGNIKLASD